MDSLWYGHKYGLVDDAVFDTLWNQCDVRAPSLTALGGAELVAAELNAKLMAMEFSAERPTELLSLRRHAAQVLLAEKAFQPPVKQDDPDCTLAYRKFMLSSSHALSQSWRGIYIDDYSLFAPVTSKEDDDMMDYMRRSDVRKALHVEEAPTTMWPSSGVGFDYTKEYDACNWGEVTDSRSMIEFYRDIAPRLMVTWVYNGDTDPCVSYEGTGTAVKRVGFPETDGGSYRPWFYMQDAASLEVLAEKAPLFGPNLLAQSVGPQMGGEVVNYENGLSFVTFHGSGHMVRPFTCYLLKHIAFALLSRMNLPPSY